MASAIDVDALAQLMAERPRSFGHLVVIGDDGTAVAEPPEVLGRIEREGRDVPQGAGSGTVQARARGLRGVLQDR